MKNTTEYSRKSDLMSEQRCLKTQIEVAEHRLIFLRKQIEKIEKTELWFRSSNQNRDYSEFKRMEKSLVMALEWMKFDETNTDHSHIDKPEPLETNCSIKQDGAYLL